MKNGCLQMGIALQPLGFISEALGHGNIRTTQSYLAGFEDVNKREVVKALTAFKQSANQT